MVDMGPCSVFVTCLVMVAPTAAGATEMFPGKDTACEKCGLAIRFPMAGSCSQFAVSPIGVKTNHAESLDSWTPARPSSGRTPRYTRNVESPRKQTGHVQGPIQFEERAVPAPCISIKVADMCAAAAPAARGPLALRLFGPLVWQSAIVVSLILIMGILASRWRLDPRRARTRARSEQAVFDLIAKLSKKHEDFRIDVQNVLEKIEAVFGLRSCSIALVRPATWQIEDIYASDIRASSSGDLLVESIAEVRRHGEKLHGMILWRHSPSSGTFAWRIGKVKPNAVASMALLGDRLAVMLVAQCQTNRRAWSTDNRTLQLITQLLAVAIEGSSHFCGTNTSSVARRSTSGAAELAGRVAHEFNNVLTSIAGYAEMTADSLQPNSSPHEYVENIQKSARRAKRIVDQILDHSLGLRTPHTLFDAGAAVVEILPDVQMCIPTSIVLYTELPDLPVRMHGNPIDLQQALINLCKNAGEAMTLGGTITVGITTVDQPMPRVLTHGRLVPGRYVHVSVTDNGPGIPDADLRRIFDSFYTTKATKGGTGLGLSVVSHAVQLLSGAMDVRTKLGFGTRFSLFFPQIIAPMSEGLSVARAKQGSSEKHLEEFALADTPHAFWHE